MDGFVLDTERTENHSKMRFVSDYLKSTSLTLNMLYMSTLVINTCFFLLCVCVFQSDLDQYKKALLDAGCDLSPLNYIKQWK